ncbi:MAG: hypothetical protein A2169_15400 [Deltaproteobacteria bacterium RBG_13_47_9]|nr:MAG: hypothetical protein A2169_15400 [Deltaproteobacteria bacterium RBG_13_47_9]
MVMMLLTVIDVSLRYVLNRPLKGAFELSTFMMTILFSFGLAYTQASKGHVAVDLFISQLPKKAQTIIGSITCFLSLILFSLATWRCFVNAKNLYIKHEVSGDLLLPTAPFVFLTGLGLLLFCCALLMDLVDYLSRLVRK